MNISIWTNQLVGVSICSPAFLVQSLGTDSYFYNFGIMINCFLILGLDCRM